MVSKNHIVRLLCLLIAFPFCIKYVVAQPDSSVPKRTGILYQKNTLSGNIRDATTNTPLPGATVYFSDLKIGIATVSDGSYTIKNVPSGRHLVEVTFVGYGGVSEYINVFGEVKKDFSLSPEIVERNEVVVTGVSAATQARRTPTPITIIKQQDLLKSVSINLVDAISKQAGVAQLSTGPSISKPVIRGLGYNRVVVIHDGVRQEGQQWGDEHGIEIDEYSVNKIEILKGPASLIYGSDAMAGVVNIIRNIPVPEGTFRGNIISNYQTNNRLRGIGANLSANKNGFNWNVHGSYKAAADYKNKYDGRVYNSKFNERSFGGYMGYNAKWGYSHILLSNFHQNVGIVEGDRDDEGRFIKPLPGGNEGLPGRSDFNSTLPQIPSQTIKHFKIVSDNSINIGKGRLGLNVGYQRNQRIEFGNVDDPDEKELYFDLNTITYNGIYHLSEINSWRIAVGLNGMVQNNTNKGEEVLIPEYSLVDIGGFAYMQKIWDNVTLSGGVRYDNRFLDSKPFRQGTEVKFVSFKKNLSNISGSIGLSYQPSERVILKLNVARGFRAPSIPELASNGVHEGTNRFEYGDVNLRSETSLQSDAGFELNADHISIEASLFYNSINNFIFYRQLQAAGGGDSTVDVDGNLIPAFQFDQHRANLAGFEFNLDLHPHPLDWLHFENTFSLVRGRFKEAVGGTRNVPFIPAARFISELRVNLLPKGRFLRNLSVKAELDNNLAQSRPFTAYGTETSTKAYSLLNAGIGSEVVSKNKPLFSIYFNALNITDNAYQNHLSRLKYAAENVVTGRAGVFNIGRNFSIKVNIPLSFHKTPESASGVE